MAVRWPWRRRRSNYERNMAMLPYIERRAELFIELGFHEVFGREYSPAQLETMQREHDALDARIKGMVADGR